MKLLDEYYDEVFKSYESMPGDDVGTVARYLERVLETLEDLHDAAQYALDGPGGRERLERATARANIILNEED